MKKCKFDPHGISLWGAAVNDYDGLSVFKESTIEVKLAKDLIDGLLKLEQHVEQVARSEGLTFIEKIKRWRL